MDTTNIKTGKERDKLDLRLCSAQIKLFSDLSCSWSWYSFGFRLGPGLGLGPGPPNKLFQQIIFPQYQFCLKNKQKLFQKLVFLKFKKNW